MTSEIKTLTFARQSAEAVYRSASLALSEGDPADPDLLDAWAAAREALTAAALALEAAIEASTGEPPREPDPAAPEDKSFSQSKGTRTMRPITKQQTPRYSVSNLLVGLTNKAATVGGYELEVSQELSRKTGQQGIIVPWSALGAVNKAQDTATEGAGGALAPTAHADDLFTITSTADFPASAATALGVPIFNAPVGNSLDIPRMISALVPGWVPTDAPLGDTTGVFDSLNLKPKTLGGLTELKHSAIQNTSPAMQMIIEQALWASVMDALDDALLGAPYPQDADAPVGLYGQLLAGATDYGIATPSELLYNLSAVADVNTTQLGMIAGNAFDPYASTTAVSAALSQSSLKSNLPESFQRVYSGRMNAFDALGTAGGAGNRNLHVMAGPWKDYAMTVLWGGGVKLEINPYGSGIFESAGIQVRVIVSASIAIRDKSRFMMCYLPTVAA